jgi:hypothetical protein
MNKEDKQRVIGKIVAINSDRFTIELLSGIDNFNVNGFDDIHYFAQLNSYVIIPYQNYYIVSEVCGVREKDLNSTYNNPTEQILSKIVSGKFLEVIPIGTIKPDEKDEKILKFDFGVSVYPSLYSDTLYIKESELDIIFKVSEQYEYIIKNKKSNPEKDDKYKRYKTLSIGKSTIFSEYDVKIDIDKFFGNHAAVLGNTGSGKSCTISSILQELFKYKDYSAVGSTFIFYDVNGEYEKSFSKLSDINKDIKIKIFTLDEVKESNVKQSFYLPHWFLNFDEWYLLLQASEKTQQPVLRNALCLASLLENQGSDLEDIKNHIVAKCCIQIWTSSESSVAAGHRIDALLRSYAIGSLSNTLLSDYNFNFKFGNFDNSKNEEMFKEKLEDAILDNFEIPSEFNSKFDLRNLYSFIDIAILYEESFGNKQIRDYCSSLLTRAKSISERSDFNFLNGKDVTLDEYKKEIIGLKNSSKKNIKNNQIILFDLSSVEDEIVEIISCVLSRIIYDTIKKIEPRNSYPVNLILEEAHRYISYDTTRNFLKANKIFELIAKEGRKFGMLLLISSQRPSELSRTVLSQCSNFIVHRIQNPEDLSHIRQITPHISDTILKRLPSIPTQFALIFGHAVNLPTTFKVNNANPTPKSENNKISENWFRSKNFKVEFIE